MNILKDNNNNQMKLESKLHLTNILSLVSYNHDVAKLVFNWSVSTNCQKNRELNEEIRFFRQKMDIIYSQNKKYSNFSRRFFHYCYHVTNGFFEDDLNIILFLEDTEQYDELNYFYNDI